MAAGAAAGAAMANNSRKGRPGGGGYDFLTPEGQIQGYMRSHFARAPSAKFYIMIPNTWEEIPDCFAYAARVQDRTFSPGNWDVLDELYGQLGYYATSDNTDMNGDIQVYGIPSSKRPSHAHRIIDAASKLCESKMEGIMAIKHHQDLLQCTMPGSSSMWLGTTVARYRYDAARHKQYLDEEVTTSTGRRLTRRQAKLTRSGRPIALINAGVDHEGNPKKKRGVRRGNRKVKPTPSFTVSGSPQYEGTLKRMVMMFGGKETPLKPGPQAAASGSQAAGGAGPRATSTVNTGTGPRVAPPVNGRPQATLTNRPRVTPTAQVPRAQQGAGPEK
ncbi:uncharacterized protein C8A04DRAFT_27393 [Dichotomopilus funicola]|uniref:DUF7689 domain-containing protein n=1 Tax=Dichotomopilus funicola TaxID=1934379 RepID=A0AAN6V5U3_9PEZI|nr:hypothetical protein C8A04DRAFT_27393 [Dichotomopilus funicola]